MKVIFHSSFLAWYQQVISLYTLGLDADAKTNLNIILFWRHEQLFYFIIELFYLKFWSLSSCLIAVCTKNWANANSSYFI